MMLFNHRLRGNNRARGEMEPQRDYYTTERALAASSLNSERRAIIQRCADEWIGRWWQATQMSCAFMTWGVGLRYVTLWGGSGPKQRAVTRELFGWCPRARRFRFYILEDRCCITLQVMIEFSKLCVRMTPSFMRGTELPACSIRN